MTAERASYVALSGGVGGAKLALGLSCVLAPDDLSIIVNTGDDFDHFGLRICPDIDSVIYALARLNNQELGWGRKAESWNAMGVLKDLGAEDWFQLGDKDLALHLERTRRLCGGEDLTATTAALAKALGCAHSVLPMSDGSVSTMVGTTEGELSFQHYFVKEQCAPSVTGFRFSGIENARPTSSVIQALEDEALAGIIICPSNPYVSVDPILQIPTMKDALKAAGVPIIAVSPIIGGKAIKGPAAKMMAELGVPSSALEIARWYQGFLDGLIIDLVDESFAPKIESLGIRCQVNQTLMTSLDDRKALADDTISFAQILRQEGEQCQKTG